MDALLPFLSVVTPIVVALVSVISFVFGGRRERRKMELAARREALLPIIAYLEDVMQFDGRMGQALTESATGFPPPTSKQLEEQTNLTQRLHAKGPHIRGILRSSVFNTRITRRYATELTTVILDLGTHISNVYLPALGHVAMGKATSGDRDEHLQRLFGAAGYLNAQVEHAYSLITELQTRLN